MTSLTGHWWVGVAAGLIVGLGAAVAVESSTGQASAQTAGQAGFTVSAAQLQINQRISQASVLRSNRALNYLAPIRTPQTDAADDGRAGVRALAQVQGAGQGWTTGQIADGAITPAKLTESVREGQPRWAAVQAGTGDLIRAKGATASAKLAPPGFYAVTFDRDISACTFQATIAPGDTAVTPVGQVSAWVNPNNANAVTVRTADADGADVNDRPFHLSVLC